MQILVVNCDFYVYASMIYVILNEFDPSLRIIINVIKRNKYTYYKYNVTKVKYIYIH